MITLIHGEDITASRKVLFDLKEKHASSEKIYFDGAKITLSDLVSSTDSLSLFGEDKLIIIENLLAGTISKEKESMLAFLGNTKSTAHIVVWEQKEIGKTVIKKYFSSAKIIFCPLPAVLFKFLDSVGVKPVGEVLNMFHVLTHDQEAELVYSMLIRQWRYLIIAADLGEKGFAAMLPWQIAKFISQARSFELKKLIGSYRQLLSLDLKVKMGRTSYTLNQLLDIFFASLYYGF